MYYINILLIFIEPLSDISLIADIICTLNVFSN